MKTILTASIAFMIALGLTSCTDSSSSSRPADYASDVAIELDSAHAGMLKVFATGALVKLGTDAAGAMANERPAMTSKFSYDFSIGKREVTCAEFLHELQNFDCDSTLPITNVTWYDAVLYANARSKSEGFDTAYIYTSAAYDSEGHCTNLEALEFLPEADAYRLPTEAEWILVAAQDWNPFASWNSGNSNYELHVPCSVSDVKDASNSVCDMAGNAMEWSNDYLGRFRDTTVSNFLGQKSAGTLGERVVKGGSFRNAASNISLHARGDVYTVTSATRAFYVGFRLAFGKIPNATWLDSGDRAEESSVELIATYKRLQELLGSSRAILAFRDDETRNIAFVNFYASQPQVVELTESDGYHPAISPDGKRVAYCTRPEGVSGNSELHVRSLQAGVLDDAVLDVESAAIPRWRVVGADTEIVYVTSAANNADEAAWKTESTWSVPFAGGKFGTPRKLFDGTYNGGVSSDGRLAVSGARLLRANVDGEQRLWYGGEQACNVSLSDSTGETLFLDFGGAIGAEFVGSSYDVHERILVADTAGSLLRTVPAPSGYAFDHSEWVHGKKDFAVATLTDMDGAHSKIALVNTRDSNVTELAAGAELWHPDLWVDGLNVSDFELDLDSAGVYETENTGAEMTAIRITLQVLYKYRDSASVLVTGSSRPQIAIDPRYWNRRENSRLFVVNAANASIDINASERMLFGYGRSILPNLKVVVFGIDLDLLSYHYHRNHNSWEANFLGQNSPGIRYDIDHDFWKDGFPEELYDLTVNAYGANESERIRYDSTYGMIIPMPPGSEIGWTKKLEISDDTTWTGFEKNGVEKAFAKIREILEKAEASGIYAIGVIFPQNPNYKNTGAFGRYGLRRSFAETMIERLQQLESEYPHFRLMDENKMGNHDYTNEMAYDWDHLSEAGAQQFSARLDSLFQTLDIQ